MLNSKKRFSSIKTPDELQYSLLHGSTFSDVVKIEENGLNEFFNLLSCYGSDSSFTITIKKPRKKKASVDPEISSLRREKEKQERALQRLHDLYLYSSESMSEKDFIIRKEQITKQIEDINLRLGVSTRNAASTLTDEDFIKQASHLLIQKELQNKEYIYFKNLAQNVSPEILRTYIETILDTILILDGKVVSITFRNGLTHKFIYKDLQPS